MKSTLAQKDTLGYMGYDGQFAVVRRLIEDKREFTKVVGFLNPAAFTEPTLAIIVKLLKDNYDEYGDVLSYKDIEFRLKEKARTPEEAGEYKKAMMQLKPTVDPNNDDREGERKDENGEETAYNLAIQRLKTLEIKRIIGNAVAYFKEKPYSVEKAATLIEEIEAIDKNGKSDETLNAEELFQEVIDAGKTLRVPTGIKELDSAMNGGLPRGSVGLIIAGTGVGKTTLGSIMVMKAALAGQRVLHLFFEDTRTDIGKKYYATLTGRYCNEYETNDPDMKEKLTKEIMGVPEYRAALRRIIPKRMDNGLDGIDNIINYIRRLIATGWKPDMIMLDYLSCVRLSSDSRLAADKEYQLLEKVMKRIEGFAQREGIAFWTEQQTNRDAFKGKQEERKSGIQMTGWERLSSVQGSFRLVQPASFTLYLDRSSDDMVNLFMDKCRGCQPTAWLNVLMNNGNCQLDMSDVPSTFDPDKAFTFSMDNDA